MKPKEWWIIPPKDPYDYEDAGYVFDHLKEVTVQFRNECINVIEKSEYDALAADNERMRIALNWLGSRAEVQKEIDELRLCKQELLDTLNWIGAIRVAPKESYPTHEIIAKVANEALKKWSNGK